MIDFRYHLVSIVSIFLALAVGIVLGAGPLKEDIGNTLTTQVKSLRDDKAALRSDLDAAEKAAEARDQFTEASNRSLLADRLKDTTVSIIILPGADAGIVKATTNTLTAAGGTIASTITVQDAWVDPDKAAFRATLGRRLASEVGVPVDETDAAVVNAVLARSVLAKVGSTVTGAAAALEALRTGELIKTPSANVKPASVAVIISGRVTGPDSAAREAKSKALSTLAGDFDGAGAGAVLVCDLGTGKTTNSTSVVTTSRADGEQSKQLSTVDNANMPMGQASIVFALLEQEAGTVGQYGLLGDATAAFPQLATK